MARRARQLEELPILTSTAVSGGRAVFRLFLGLNSFLLLFFIFFFFLFFLSSCIYNNIFCEGQVSAARAVAVQWSRQGA